ncbi:type II toxin-antitoxin system RelE/ParE family toxin [Ancylobacter terrae]|uniref:type II toxin-antitoxin system RelE/ParE family toxin n=1 Tax=Ancylobacter sp. sgz301288 TaxID=3342077 RepID=UPI00385F0966
MPNVVFRPLAEDDLLGLYEYITRMAGHGVAAGYIDRLEAACLSLVTFPERGRARDDIVLGVRTLAVKRRVLIVYREWAGQVEILRVLYGGRDTGGAFL